MCHNTLKRKSKEASDEEGTWIQLAKIKSVWEYKQENLDND